VLKRLNWCYRLLATGLAFTLFGLGGLLLPLYAVPWLRWFTRDTGLRERRARWLVQKNFRLFVEFMRISGILRYRIEGLSDLQRPGQLILANHPSLIDVVFLIAFVPQADCVVKNSLMRNPFMRSVLSLGNYIVNDDPQRVIAASAASLARGNSLIIFPEGTRTVPGQPIKLQRGAANVAVRLGVPVRPVIIAVVPSTLTKAEPWYSIPREGPFQVLISAQTELAMASDDNRPSLAARKLTIQLQNYFTQELARYAGT
jgi:1-acyl-sn-glycerol-3-phosphate acyltransferase